MNALKRDPLWKDEMQGYTDTYLDYVKSLSLGFENTPSAMVEKHIDLDMYIPSLPEEDPAGGTADCILIGGGVLHIIDFKYGKGVPVSAEGNPQLSLYALGAYEAYKILYPIERIELHIVQPRISDEPSEWGCSLTELLAFGRWVKQRAASPSRGKVITARQRITAGSAAQKRPAVPGQKRTWSWPLARSGRNRR